jgi:hypothetical protein
MVFVLETTVQSKFTDLLRRIVVALKDHPDTFGPVHLYKVLSIT